MFVLSVKSEKLRIFTLAVLAVLAGNPGTLVDFWYIFRIVSWPDNRRREMAAVRNGKPSCS